MPKQSFFFVLKKEMYDKLFEGKIPSLKDFTIGMYRFYDSVADKLKNYSDKSDTEFIIFEIGYTKDELKEMYFSKKLLPPSYWLYENKMMSLNEDDARLLEHLYHNAIWDFKGISITKDDIVSATYIRKNEEKVIYKK